MVYEISIPANFTYMFQDWLRIDQRLWQYLRLWNIFRAIHIYKWWTVIFWPFELLLGVLHVLGMSHVLMYCLKTKSTRSLTPEELQIGKLVFGSQMDYQLVRLNPASKIARKLKIAFVTGNQINFDQRMSDRLLVHELTHVFQFQQVGIVYIPRCLKAQHSREGYDIGEVLDHIDILNGLSHLGKLNYEQQAELLETLFVQRNNAALAYNFHRVVNRMNMKV